jgi:hypothetical protein
MNNSLGVNNYFSQAQESLQNLPAIQKLLEEIGTAPTLVAKLNAACEIYDFQLGDEIAKYQKTGVGNPGI